MEWSEKLQAIAGHVENHLQKKEEPIDTQEISRIAGCSFDFFQKVFSYMNGISFAEYVRARKLTLAGYDLKSTNMKVVDISYKYGYNSPTSFTKAFQQFHGVSPREARQKNTVLKVYPKMQVFPYQQYAWKLEQKSSFRLIGKSIHISNKEESSFIRIPEFWGECQKNGVFSELISMDTGIPKGLFGLFRPYEGQAGKQAYGQEYSIMAISDYQLPQGFTEVMIPEATWAVFDCKGAVPQAIHRGWRYLNEEWLLKYPFQHAKCPELEWYSNGNFYDENYLSQIWIPII